MSRSVSVTNSSHSIESSSSDSKCRTYASELVSRDNNGGTASLVRTGGVQPMSSATVVGTESRCYDTSVTS